MARARNLKPSFFQNEDLAACGPLGMILFEGLWCHADREGRLEDRPIRIKVQVLPYFDADCEKLLSCLHDGGFINRYEVEGRKYIQVLNFTKHQNPHVKETVSTIPAPDKNSTSPVNTGTDPADSLNPITDSLNPIKSTAANASAPSPEVEIPPGLDLSAWVRWIEYRKQIRKPLKPVSIPAAQQELAAFGSDQAAVVQQSIANGYQGIFPLKTNGGHHAKPSKLQIAANAIRDADERAGRRRQNTAFQDGVQESGLRAITYRSADGDSSHD